MIIWSVEDGGLIKYERSGECNRCGDCCGHKGQISFQMKFAFDDSDDKDKVEDKDESDWSEYEGWSILYAQGIFWWFKITNIGGEGGCHYYDSDKRLCTTWMSDRYFKPICRYWPFHPSNLEQFPNCGFSFERVE